MPEHCVATGVHTGASGHEHAPHVQVDWQVCVPYVSQVWVALGAQAPCTQVPSSQVPLAVHVCVSTPQLPAQVSGFVWPGAHTPVHTAATQVCLTHATLSHWPHVSHVSAASLVAEHCVAAGVHTDADGHEQALQAQLASQVCVP